MYNTIFGYFFIKTTAYSLDTIFLFEHRNQINSHNVILSMVQFTIYFVYACTFGTKVNKIVLLNCCIVIVLLYCWIVRD